MEVRPEVSIVIAAYNEERHIRECLQSVFDAEPFAPAYEVLVVDGRSTDATREVVTDVARERPSVRLLDNPQRFAPQAFNIGIRASRGDWIFVLGAHSRYDPSYFRLCLETARRTGAANTGGRVIWRTSDDGIAARLALAVGFSRFGFGSSPYRRRDVREGPSGTAVFGCFPRSTFERFGLYDERLILNQDWELNQRILRGGGVVWLNPDIRVYYFARQTVRSMLSRAWETGRWVAYMWRLAPHSVTPRHAVPAAFIAIAAVPGLGLAVLAAHQVAAAGAALSEAVRLRDPRLALALPPMFLALHASYGGGTLAGLVEVVTGRKRLDRSSPVERLAPLPSPPSAGRRPPPGRQQAASARPRTRSPKARRT